MYQLVDWSGNIFRRGCVIATRKKEKLEALQSPWKLLGQVFYSLFVIHMNGISLYTRTTTVYVTADISAFGLTELSLTPGP